MCARCAREVAEGGLGAADDRRGRVSTRATPLFFSFFDDDLHSDAVRGCDSGRVTAPTAANGPQSAS